MGCGCGRSNIASVNKSRAIKPQSNTTPKADSNAACIQKYDELAVLDKKIIDLHRKFRFVGGVSKRYADIQKLVRGWIVNLKNECPDPDDLATYSEYINEEYARYFTVK
mgnify:FL=1